MSDRVDGLRRPCAVDGDVVQGAGEGSQGALGVGDDVTGQQAASGPHLDGGEASRTAERLPHAGELDRDQRAEGRVRRRARVVVRVGAGARVVPAARVVQGRLHELGEGNAAPLSDPRPYLPLHPATHAAAPASGSTSSTRTASAIVVNGVSHANVRRSPSVRELDRGVPAPSQSGFAVGWG